MAITTLGAWIQCFREEFGSERNGRILLRELLRTLETVGVEGDRKLLVAAARKIRAKALFDVYQELLTEQGEALAKTIYSISSLGMPSASARKLFGAKVTDLREASRLAQKVGVRLGTYASRVDPRTTPWAANVLRGRQRITLVVTQEALQDLIFVAAEGYRVPKGASRPKGKGRHRAVFTEVYGLCFGTINQQLQESPWKVREVFYTVERCVPQLRAHMRTSAVNWNSESIKVQHDVASRLSPQWQILGDFHSHPYRDLAAMRAARGWEFSAADERVNQNFTGELERLGHRPVIGLVIAVAKKGKAVSASEVHGHGPHTARFTLGPFEYVLGAWVNPTDHTYWSADEIRCHGIGS
jgi:hypothetical protein